MIVVGAGIIGLSCAWRLAQKGCKVTIFDTREAAREAGWAAAGMLAPGGEFEAESPAASLALRSLELYPEFVRELEEESGLSIDFRRCGAVDLSPPEETGAVGIHSRLTTWAGRPARFYPDDALVDPREVTRALIQACGTRGVTIRENEPVNLIHHDGRGVRTNKGEYTDEGVLIAAGAWSVDLYPGLPPAFPVRGHLIAWRMEPGALDPILREGHTYLMQRTSGLLIAGSTTERVGFNRELDEKAIEDIVRRARALFPALPREPPNLRWNGFRPGVEAEMPLIGQVAGTRVWTAYGHYRNGVLMAPETARMIAEGVRC